MGDLRIIIVSWNVRDRLRECLGSIMDTTAGSSLRCHVVVVDNASHDGSVEMVREEFPQAVCIANTENQGFARANNQGIRIVFSAQRTNAPLPPNPPSPLRGEGGRGGAGSAPEFFLLLNPDMRVLPGTLEGIVAFLREPRNVRVGIAGCHLIDERGGTVSHVRRFPMLPDQLAVMLKIPHVFPHVLDHYLVRDFDYDREARVDSIRGSFFCIRRKLIEQIGLLDERFFIWFEEVDYCLRARQAGWQVAYTPTARCIDYVGQSFAQVRLYPKQRMVSESMLKYFRKHRPVWEWATLAAMRPAVLGAAWAYDKLRVKSEE